MTATQKVGLVCLCISLAYFTLSAIICLGLAAVIRDADQHDPYDDEHLADVEKVHDLAAPWIAGGER